MTLPARLALLAVALTALAGPSARAQGLFLPATDARLRADVLLLADEGVINLPTNAWPIPAGDLARAVARVKGEDIAEPALVAALDRVRRYAEPPADHDDWRIREVSLTVGEAGLLRGYGTLGRDAAELNSTGGVQNDRWSMTVSATGVASPDDGRHLRLDGSELSIRWGNWLFSANQMSRWWGPGWDGSLILSTNARPMPGISLDRLASEPFDFPILRWLGPWRFTGLLSRMDEYRADVDAPLFMGMRFSFKPLQIVELGVSRTAQFCGRERPCNAKTFWNMLAGHDNAGLRVSAKDEPGNQMAGFDVRIASPIQALPFAIYGQFIGEDSSSSGIPERYLGQMGFESWVLLARGSILRWHVEYANTNCKFGSPSANPNCAYRQGIFYAGYRYHSRSIGYTTDGDSESLMLGVQLTRPQGDGFGLTLRRALLDRRGGIDLYNPLTRGPGETRSAELSWQGGLLGQAIALAAGYEENDRGTGSLSGHLYGFLQLRHAF